MKTSIPACGGTFGGGLSTGGIQHRGPDTGQSPAQGSCGGEHTCGYEPPSGLIAAQPMTEAMAKHMPHWATCPPDGFTTYGCRIARPSAAWMKCAHRVCSSNRMY